MAEHGSSALLADYPVGLIHIGFHKTASTYLQRRYFSSLKRVKLLNDSMGSVDLDQWFFTNFINVSPYHFDAKTFAQRFSAALRSAGSEAGDNLLVLSDENLSGDMYTGLDARELMHRVYQVFPNSEVLMVLRNQPDYLLSAYSNYVLQGGTDWFRRWLRGGGTTRWGMIFEKLKYSALVEGYLECFGASRVHLVLYEELWSEEWGVPAVMRRLGVDGAAPRAQGRREMQGRPLYANHLLAKLNCLGAYHFRYRNRLLALLPKLHDEWAYAVRALGEEAAELVADNQRLAQLLGRELPAEYRF